MQTQINAPLQALLQTAAMVTPDKQNSTVAAKYAQAAQQKMQAQAMPPGIAALMPGVKQQAMMSAQAAQPATQGDVNQLRQMMAQAQQAQPQQNQGIAAGADVQMAEGGIVGYDGRTGSQVEVDETKLSVDERIRRKLEDFIKGTYYGSKRDLAQQAAPTVEPPASPVPLPVRSDVRRQEIPEGGIVSPGMVQQAPAPSPRPPSTPRPTSATAATGIASTPLLPDTRESTLVNPSQSAVQYATEVGRLKELQERLGKKPEESPQEKAYREAAMAQYQRGIGSIDAARDRFNAAQLEQRNKDLINYLSGIGGAGSLFRGMTRSGQALSQVQDQREAAKIAYFDKLDERRNAVENLKLASLKQDAEQARAWSNEVRKIDADITRLMVGLGEKQAGESAIAEREREKTAATARENELNRKAQRELEEYRRQTQLMKPHELKEIHRIEDLKLNELTGGKPGTATPQQKLEAIQFAHESVKGAPRAGSIDAKNNAEALRQLGQWEKDVGANIKAMNAKNPQVYEDARRAKIREINATLGSTMPLDGGAAGAVDTNNPLLKK